MRMTRAAMRAQALDDEMTIHVDADAPEPEQPGGDGNGSGNDEEPGRPVLKDITELNSSPVARDSAEQTVQHVETEAKDAPAPAPHASETELESEPGTDKGDDSTPTEEPATEQATEHATEQATPPRAIVSSAKTPKFDPDLHIPAESQSQAADDGAAGEDSFVDSIKSRSPAKLRRESAEPDSFVDKITSRTPVRPQSRVEDSVEAIDALEDAIEHASGILPEIGQLNLESPVKSTKKTALSSLQTQKNTPKNATPLDTATKRLSKAPLDTITPSKTPLHTKTPSKTPLHTKTPSKTPLHTKTPSKTPASVKSRPDQSEAMRSKTLVGRLSTANPAKRPSILAKPTSSPAKAMAKAPPQLSFSNSPLKQQQQPQPQPSNMRRTTSGSLSTSRPGFVPAKSTKAPTRPNFSLPGEAIAAKMKAQREERAKREEAEKSRQSSFKARPAPPKTSRPSLAPRENRASLVRLSAVRSGSNKENVMPRQVPATVSNPAKSVSVAKTRPSGNTANSSVRRSTIKPGTTAATAAAPRLASLTAGEKVAVSKENAARQKVKGKEVFGRSKMEQEAAEREKREKEAAAKRARAEAAEKGRQASREWAERQKRKMEAAKAAKAAA